MVIRHLPRAVSGGADAVGDVDTALARDPGDETGLNPRDAGGGSLEAVAGGLAVRRGLGGVIESPHPAAASFCERPRALGVAKAGNEVGDHLAAADRGLRRVRREKEKAGEREWQESAGGSHGYVPLLVSLLCL
ncbi:hypothetical protein BHE74_00040254 [Ensete ventricosum]|nr:hypothetical protein BHE74_00040254 [Ensete ventricosum]